MPVGAVKFASSGSVALMIAAFHVAPSFAKRYDEVPAWAHKRAPGLLCDPLTFAHVVP